MTDDTFYCAPHVVPMGYLYVRDLNYDQQFTFYRVYHSAAQKMNDCDNVSPTDFDGEEICYLPQHVLKQCDLDDETAAIPADILQQMKELDIKSHFGKRQYKCDWKRRIQKYRKRMNSRYPLLQETLVFSNASQEQTNSLSVSNVLDQRTSSATEDVILELNDAMALMGFRIMFCSAKHPPETVVFLYDGDFFETLTFKVAFAPWKVSPQRIPLSKMSMPSIDGSSAGGRLISTTSIAPSLASTRRSSSCPSRWQCNVPIDRECVTAANISRHRNVRKFWKDRTLLFRRFEEGIQLDEESWFSVTYECVAEYQAQQFAGMVIVDLCCGAGGNTIAFARFGSRVIAVDSDPVKVALCRSNCEVYGVAEKVDFLVGDVFDIVQRLCHYLPGLVIDAVHVSPPWGGLSGVRCDLFDIYLNIPFDLRRLLQLCRTRLTPKVMAVYLPKRTNFIQVVDLRDPREDVCVEQNYLMDEPYAITVYFYALSSQSADPVFSPE